MVLEAAGGPASAPNATFASSEVLSTLDQAILEAESLTQSLQELRRSVALQSQVLPPAEDQRLTERAIRSFRRHVGAFSEEVELLQASLNQRAYPRFPALFQPVMPIVPNLINGEAPPGAVSTRASRHSASTEPPGTPDPVDPNAAAPAAQNRHESPSTSRQQPGGPSTAPPRPRAHVGHIDDDLVGISSSSDIECSVPHPIDEEMDQFFEEDEAEGMEEDALPSPEAPPPPEVQMEAPEADPTEPPAPTDPKLHMLSPKVCIHFLHRSILEQLAIQGHVLVPDNAPAAAETPAEDTEEELEEEEEDEMAKKSRILAAALKKLQRANRVCEQKNREARASARVKVRAPLGPVRRRRRLRVSSSEESELDSPDEEAAAPTRGLFGAPPPPNATENGEVHPAGEEGADSDFEESTDDEEAAARRALLKSSSSSEEEEEASAPPAAAAAAAASDSRKRTRGSPMTRLQAKLHFSPPPRYESSTEEEEEEEPSPRRYPKRRRPQTPPKSSATAGPPGAGAGAPKQQPVVVVNDDDDSDDGGDMDFNDEGLVSCARALTSPRRRRPRARVIISCSSEEEEADPVAEAEAFEESDISDGDRDSFQLLGDAGAPYPVPMFVVKKEPVGAPFDEEEEEEEEDDDSVEVPVPSRRRFDITSTTAPKPAAPGPPKPRGRRNIKPVIPDEKLSHETRRAAAEEEARLLRIQERDQELQRLQELNPLPGFVLDQSPEAVVEVAPRIAHHLKQHQKEGIKFMWEAAFESAARALESDGGGCILAHNMGLGKTLQVIALLHTVLRNCAALGGKFKHALVVCPKNVVRNWRDELKTWQNDIVSTAKLACFVLSKAKPEERLEQLRDWRAKGGVALVHYDILRQMLPVVPPPKREANGDGAQEEMSPSELYEEALRSPGPALVVLDEGHILKNRKSQKFRLVDSIETKRKIIMTGTPLQNDLEEFYAIVELIKPSLLGSWREFRMNFLTPIQNGQHSDSNPLDVKIMKERVFVLTKLVAGCHHRRTDELLKKELPPMHQYTLAVSLAPLQARLYNEWLRRIPPNGRRNVFLNFQTLSKIIAHPNILTRPTTEDKRVASGRRASARAQRKAAASAGADAEGEEEDRVITSGGEQSAEEDARLSDRWFYPILMAGAGAGGATDLHSFELSAKLQVLRTILQICEAAGEKVLVFSQFLNTLDQMESMLGEMHAEHEERLAGGLGAQQEEQKEGFSIGTWKMGLDYCRMDGKTPMRDRLQAMEKFNDEGSKMKLFLLCTRAGSLGINLVGASRVCVFDASLNPSHDLQGIHRVFRYGQTRPCFVYRLIAQATIEEKVYHGQIVKLELAQRVVDEKATLNSKTTLESTLTGLYEEYPDGVKSRELSAAQLAVLTGDLVLSRLWADHSQFIPDFWEHSTLLQDDRDLTPEEGLLAVEGYQRDRVNTRSRTAAAPRPGPGPSNANGAAAAGLSNGTGGGGGGKRGRPRKAGGPSAACVPRKLWKNIYYGISQLHEKDKDRTVHFRRVQLKAQAVEAAYACARNSALPLSARREAYERFEEGREQLQKEFQIASVQADLNFIFPKLTLVEEAGGPGVGAQAEN